jgi:hypothetical protein
LDGIDCLHSLQTAIDACKANIDTQWHASALDSYSCAKLISLIYQAEANYF